MTAPSRASEFAELYRVEAPRLWRAMLAFTANPKVASDVAEALPGHARAARQTLTLSLFWTRAARGPQ
jgi:hypothetical protein